MTGDRNNLTEILTLTLIVKKQVVESSYFFHQLYTRLGIFEPIDSIIQALRDKNYILHEGDFGENLGLTKNITITDEGRNHLQKTLNEETVSEMKTEFDNFELVEKALYSELPNSDG